LLLYTPSLHDALPIWAVELGVDVVDALHQLLDRVAHRAELDADRAILARRLHDHRELDVVGVLGAPAIDRAEVRRVDAVEGEDRSEEHTSELQSPDQL